MRPRHDDPYLIAPRYLAGPDELIATGIATHLLTHGWSSAPNGDGIAYALRTPGGLLEATHTAGDSSTGHRPCPSSGWEFTARSGPGQMAAWNAFFAPTTPPELIAALATALTAPEADHALPDRPHYLRKPLPPEEATRPLEAAGWRRDLARHECAWCSPDQQAVVVTSHAPGQHHCAATNWLFATRRAIDNVALWHAVAHPHTPTHFVRALCAAFTDPAPVPRGKCPGPEVGLLSITCP